MTILYYIYMSTHLRELRRIISVISRLPVALEIVLRMVLRLEAGRIVAGPMRGRRMPDERRIRIEAAATTGAAAAALRRNGWYVERTCAAREEDSCLVLVL